MTRRANVMAEIGCRSSSARPTSSVGEERVSRRPLSSSRSARSGLEASPISEILIEKSIAGWKEYELEVMRDRADNCVIICSIENFDPMGVHTGDSITVAPAQTLSDVEYQRMRDAAFACIRRVGVETGGSNVQFAVDPSTGEQVVIEMNPRVSRSSALASKATGFPIAKIAAKLAIGYTLDEIPNDITKMTPASFEPTIDYIVTKIPRWAFEKLPGTSGVLGTQMQSVGEVMSIGRTFPESLQKALRSLEQGRAGLNADGAEKQFDGLGDDELLARVGVPTPDRIFQIGELLRRDRVDRTDSRRVPRRSMVPRSDVDPHRGATATRVDVARIPRGAGLEAGQAARFQRRSVGVRVGSDRGRGTRRSARSRCHSHVQDRRHLFGRIRGRDAVSLLDLRGRERDSRVGPTACGDPWLGTQPHRTGHRVRLLLCARVLSPCATPGSRPSW
jgi:hypothetical protein